MRTETVDPFAKAKEVQANTQADIIAPHLLLRQHTPNIGTKALN